MKHTGKWSKFFTISLALFIVIAIAAVAYGAGGGEGAHHGGDFTPARLKDLLWRVLNFAALVVILVKFLAKPIANGLRARQQSIKDQFADLEERKAEADSTYRTYEEKLGAIDQEIQEIIQAAIAQGEAEKERIINEANRAAEDIKRQAEMAIQHELAEAKLKLREEVANQAVAMAEELIRKNLQETDQVKLIDDYLAKVGTVQ